MKLYKIYDNETGAYLCYGEDDEEYTVYTAAEVIEEAKCFAMGANIADFYDATEVLAFMNYEVQEI